MDLSGLGYDVRILPTGQEPPWETTEFWLVIVTVLLVGVTAWLAWATRQLVKGAEKTSRQQLRAYVALEDAVLTPGHAAQRLVCRFRLRNVGTTPANNVRQWIAARFEASPDLASYPPTVPLADSGGSTGPGQIIPLNLVGPLLTAEDLAAFQTGTMWLHVYGKVTYRDVFEQDHETNFRFIHGVWGGYDYQPDLLLKRHEGNEAT